MALNQAGAVRTRPHDSGRETALLAAAPLLAVVLALVVTLTSLSASQSIGKSAGQAPVTVIATSVPAPPDTPSAFEPAGAPSKPGYHLVFNDEFAGSKIDRKVWQVSLPWGTTNLGEQQRYTPDALNVRNGVLSITADQKATNGRDYASGVISSADHFYFKYGYAEIRAQVPAGNGLWSAFWLLANVKGGNEETDIMEILGSDPTLGYAVLHYGTMTNKKKTAGTYRKPDFSEGFHRFAVDWEPDRMIWYVDGVERYRVTKNIPAHPMHIIANLAVGEPGSWSGAPDRYTQLPARFKIDYIRVFQRD